VALLLFPWVVSGALRSLRGRSSQVKGAYGVAVRWRLRATLDLRASAAPPGSVTGRPEPALHNAQRPRTPLLSWTDQHVHPFTQVTHLATD